MTANTTLPAAQYVRMSTEDQQYSIDNQKAAIQEYAVKHGFHVTRTYADPGRSGLVINRRDGLNGLLQDVISRQADYRAILVYDISRWGRFQDTNEAAHYEFLCKQAGIPIHYCAEPFANDGTLPSSILKSRKRTMAGEYSRELSVKVSEGQRRLTLLGFRMGGPAAYGLSRMIVSKDGKRKRKLKAGDWKSITTDRTILVPGPKKQVECVRQIFSMTLAKRTPRQISDDLNRKGTKYVHGRPWNKLAVYRILRNPEYAGYSAWGPTSQKLHTRSIRLPRSQWTVKSGSFVPIIDEATFLRAQKIVLKRKTYPRRSDEEILEKLKRVLLRHGKLSESIINRSRGVFHERTYWKRFGSLLRVYELIGYKASRHMIRSVQHRESMRALQKQLMNQLRELFPDHVRIVVLPGRRKRVVEIDQTHRVSLFLRREFRTIGGRPRWMFRINPFERDNTVLVCRVDSSFREILSCHVLPAVGNSVRMYRQLHERHPWLATGTQLYDLTNFYTAVMEILARSSVRKS